MLEKKYEPESIDELRFLNIYPLPEEIPEVFDYLPEQAIL